MYYKLNSSQYVVFFSKARRISSRFHGCDIFDDFCTPKLMVPREKQNRQLSSSLFFPHEHKSASQFWVVALQFYPTTKNKRFLLVFTHSSGVSRTPTTSYTFFVARCGANEKDRERVASKVYQSGTIDARVTKIQIESSWDKRASFFQYRCFLRAF